MGENDIVKSYVHGLGLGIPRRLQYATFSQGTRSILYECVSITFLSVRHGRRGKCTQEKIYMKYSKKKIFSCE